MGDQIKTGDLSQKPVRDTVSFAHPAEKIFAHILDFYGIEWQYEPKNFPLEWDTKGNIISAFSPDFYLPSQDLFIELTTLKPQLTTHKNNKLRRFRELYPDTKIKLLKRKEMRDLMIKYGLIKEAQKIQGAKAQKGTYDW